MIPLTFLAARMPLVKHFSLSETQNYPLAKRFTSFSYKTTADAEGFRLFYRYLLEHAEKNHSFYKGNLKNDLKDESRAGKTLISEKTQLLVVDIDKFEFFHNKQNWDKKNLEEIAEYIIRNLPIELHNVSYIAQASSSLGLKSNTVSLHLFFFLDQPVAPQLLKWWLCKLNFSLPKFEEKLELNPTGHSLNMIIDRCMAENSRIIYIAPPIFDSTLKNPFSKNTDRIILVEKEKTLAEISKNINNTSPQLVEADIANTTTKLREEKGLPKRSTKLKMVKVGPSREEQVLLNPDKAVIQYAYHNDTFCVANLNNGDSNAYYWPLENPKWVYNFKGEPIFEMAKVDSDFYKWYLEEFRDKVVKDAKLRPVVFRDFVTDAYYTVEYDPEKNRMIRFSVVARQSLNDFMQQYWEPLPDPIPTWDVFFDPKSSGGINFDNRSLNLFTPTPYMEELIDLPSEITGVGYGEAYEGMNDYMPNITKLIYHMLGNGEVEFEHFINWLAYVFVHREKTNVAWIMHGVEGTGKGLFFTQILQHLFGKKYSVMKRMKNLEDNFDGWKEHNLITVIDEFRLADTTSQSRMYDDIKNMISEPFGTVRYMRANQKEVPLYSNYLFFSNNEDAMKISASDRRFCLGLRQNVKIDVVFDLPKMLDGIEGELPRFSMFLREFQIDVHQARVALDNKAKTDMRAASNSWVDDFSIALLKGNFSFFFEAVMFHEVTKSEDSILLSKCREIVSSWLLDYVQLQTEHIQVNVEDARLIYSLLAGRDARPAEFGKVLSRRGMIAPRFRHNNRLGRWIEVKFQFEDYDPIALIKEHGSPAQRQQVSDHGTH